MTWTWRILSETETNESIMYHKDRPHQQRMKPNVYWLSEQDGNATRQFASENHDCLRGLVNIENYFYTKTLLISPYPELAYRHGMNSLELIYVKLIENSTVNSFFPWSLWYKELIHAVIKKVVGLMVPTPHHYLIVMNEYNIDVIIN